MQLCKGDIMRRKFTENEEEEGHNNNSNSSGNDSDTDGGRTRSRHFFPSSRPHQVIEEEQGDGEGTGTTSTTSTTAAHASAKSIAKAKKLSELHKMLGTLASKHSLLSTAAPTEQQRIGFSILNPSSSLPIPNINEAQWNRQQQQQQPQPQPFHPPPPLPPQQQQHKYVKTLARNWGKLRHRNRSIILKRMLEQLSSSERKADASEKDFPDFFSACPPPPFPCVRPGIYARRQTFISGLTNNIEEQEMEVMLLSSSSAGEQQQHQQTEFNAPYMAVPPQSSQGESISSMMPGHGDAAAAASSSIPSSFSIFLPPPLEEKQASWNMVSLTDTTIHAALPAEFGFSLVDSVEFQNIYILLQRLANTREVFSALPLDLNEHLYPHGLSFVSLKTLNNRKEIAVRYSIDASFKVKLDEFDRHRKERSRRKLVRASARLINERERQIPNSMTTAKRVEIYSRAVELEEKRQLMESAKTYGRIPDEELNGGCGSGVDGFMSSYSSVGMGKSGSFGSNSTKMFGGSSSGGSFSSCRDKLSERVRPDGTIRSSSSGSSSSTDTPQSDEQIIFDLGLIDPSVSAPKQVALTTTLMQPLEPGGARRAAGEEGGGSANMAVLIPLPEDEMDIIEDSSSNTVVVASMLGGGDGGRSAGGGYAIGRHGGGYQPPPPPPPDVENLSIPSIFTKSSKMVAISAAGGEGDRVSITNEITPIESTRYPLSIIRNKERDLIIQNQFIASSSRLGGGRRPVPIHPGLMSRRKTLMEIKRTANYLQRNIEKAFVLFSTHIRLPTRFTITDMEYRQFLSTRMRVLIMLSSATTTTTTAAAAAESSLQHKYVINRFIFYITKI